MLSKQEVLDWVKFSCDTCETPELFEKITVKYSARMTRTLGRAFYDENKIKLSTKYINHPDYTEMEFIETIIHEACHLICYHIYGDSLKIKTGKNKIRWDSHGARWKRLMVKCGVPPERLYTGKARIKRNRKNLPPKYIYAICTDCERIVRITQKDYYYYKNDPPGCENFNGDCCFSGLLLNVNGKKFPDLRKNYEYIFHDVENRIKNRDFSGNRYQYA